MIMLMLSLVSTDNCNEERKKSLEDFEKENHEGKAAVLTSVRALSEGIDCPSVDMVAFMQPKRGTVAIMQAAPHQTRQARREASSTLRRGLAGPTRHQAACWGRCARTPSRNRRSRSPKPVRYPPRRRALSY